MFCGEWVLPREDAGARCQLDWKPRPCWSLPGPASHLPAAGRGFRRSSAVLFSDTRGDPCLGFPRAEGRLCPCRDCAVHQSLGVFPPLLRGSQRRSRLVAFTFPLTFFPCAAAWVTHQDAMGCVPTTHGGSFPCPAQIPGGSTTGRSIGMQGRIDGGTSSSTQTRGICDVVPRLSSHLNPAAELAAKGS